MTRNDKCIRPLNFDTLPPDLLPKDVYSGDGQTTHSYMKESDPKQVADRHIPPRYATGNAILLSRALNCDKITIGTSPVQIVKAPSTWPYLILNPSASVGLTTTITGHASSAETAAGNTQSVSIGVAGHQSVHLHTIVTAITGTWDLFTQSYDSVSGTWVDVQAILSGLTSTVSQYDNLNSMGIATDLAFRWVPTVAGSMTFSIGVVLKDGIGGSGNGLANTIYLGGQNVTTISGYPLLSGNRETFILEEGLDLYAIAAQTGLSISVFRL